MPPGLGARSCGSHSRPAASWWRSLGLCWCAAGAGRTFETALLARPAPWQVGKPFAVGGEAIISTASYAARRFGVRSAMPGFIARKLCPHLIFVKHDFSKYVAASEATR